MDRNNRPGTPQTVPSKVLIINWVKSLFPDLSPALKIQELGQGVIYARILNHYYGNPAHSKISNHPKNQYDYINNLKHVQTALTQLGIVIPFDVNKIAKCKFLQNWTLVNSFYKHFHHSDQTNNQVQDNSVSSHGNNTFPNKKPSRPPPQNHSIEHDPRINFHKQNSQITFQTQAYSQMKDRQYSNNINTQINSLANNSLKLTTYLKQNVNLHNNSPSKGKWSVGSQMFQNNHNAVIDRIKQILLKGSHDTQKVRQIKMLLGMPTQQQQVIKIEEDDYNGAIVYGATFYEKPSNLQKEDKIQQRLQSAIKQAQEDNGKQSLNKLSSAKKVKKPFKI